MRTIPWYYLFDVKLRSAHAVHATFFQSRMTFGLLLFYRRRIWKFAITSFCWRKMIVFNPSNGFSRIDILVQTCPSTHVSSGGPCRSVFDCSSVTEDVCYKDPNTPSSSAQMGVCCRSLCPPGFTAKANSVCSSHNECTVLFGQRMFCYSPTSNTGICCG